MATHEISPDQWESFFTVFNERRSGATVTVEIADPQKGLRKAETNQPLTSISVADGNIVLKMGGNGGDAVTRTITQPKTVYHKSAAGMMSDEVNHDEIIEVTSAGDPPVTQLHFSG
jgi:hypothetical protein